MQELRETMRLFSKDKGAVVRAAKAKLEKAKGAQAAAQAEHAEQQQALESKNAERDNAVGKRQELTQQLEAAEAAEQDAAVRFLTCPSLLHCHVCEACALQLLRMGSQVALEPNKHLLAWSGYSCLCHHWH